MTGDRFLRFTILATAMSVLSLTAVDTAQATEIHDFEAVFGVGCSGNPALDPGGAALPCAATVSWTHEITFDPGHLKEAMIKIVAEGIDAFNEPGGPGPEMDQVFVNGVFVGLLTNQSFYSPDFNLQPGPGALPGTTELTMSIFDVTAFLVSGVNTIQVVVDPGNWVLEIETSELWARVPEPATWSVLALGLVLGMIPRRRL